MPASMAKRKSLCKRFFRVNQGTTPWRFRRSGGKCQNAPKLSAARKGNVRIGCERDFDELFQMTSIALCNPSVLRIAKKSIVSSARSWRQRQANANCQISSPYWVDNQISQAKKKHFYHDDSAYFNKFSCVLEWIINLPIANNCI